MKKLIILLFMITITVYSFPNKEKSIKVKTINHKHFMGKPLK